ncbi:helix-turn-helix transcriptional regulator [Microbacterium sp.]|uniref:helix-turn-helix transcriptional regulator n=1 Tax=Microbacterium sp. TaxID=51671 RepID=UPI0039E47F24
MIDRRETPNFDALRLRLSQLRAARGWTYERLAEYSGVSRATLIAMETGSSRNRRPGKPASRGSLESWWRIAHAFDLSAAELLSALDEL